MLSIWKYFLLTAFIFTLSNVGLHGVAAEGETPEGAQSASASAATEDNLDDESTVESDDKSATTGIVSDSEHEDDENKESGPQKSPDAEAIIMFTKPALGARTSGNGVELPAGQLVNVLIGFTNKGKKEFVIDAMDAQFHYPQDHSFYLQNFTRAQFNQLVDPGRQASLAYSFVPAQQLSGRPFGLTVMLYYHEASEGRQFIHSVFNDTVQLVELDEGFDTESFFLYLFMVGVAFLAIFGIYHLFVTVGKKRLLKRGGGGSSSRGVVEMGTGTNADVDLEWIPKEHLDLLQKRQSPRQSPRSRKAKRQENHHDEE